MSNEETPKFNTDPSFTQTFWDQKVLERGVPAPRLGTPWRTYICVIYSLCRPHVPISASAGCPSCTTSSGMTHLGGDLT